MSGATATGAARRLAAIDVADRVVLALYAALTLALTYPLSWRPASLARDYGDPLLNAWIMAWEVDQVLAGNFSGFFDTNVFYPHLNTLAYSEFLVPQAIAGAPIYLLSGNALLAHNLLTLLAITSTAFCAYALVRHLTADRYAAFVGGLVFAYNPFMFDHLSHLQVLTAAGLPLSLLWLHRYFETGAFRYVALFSTTFVLQALANAYYAVYLTYAAAAFILLRAIVDRSLTKARFWAHMSAHALFSVAVLAPFFWRFVELRSTLGFRREMAQVWGQPFLATPAINRLYGSATISISSPEAKLFPGLIAAALALAGAVAYLWGRSPLLAWRQRTRAELGYRGLGWVAALAAAVILAILTWGGFSGTVLGIAMRSNRLTNPLLLLAGCLAGRAMLRFRHEELRGLARRAWGGEAFYVGLLVVGAVLSMGAAGPYRLLYEYLPGFDAIRAVPRIHVLTMLGLSVLAGFGVTRLRERFPSLARPVFAVALVVLICVEYVSVPVEAVVIDDPPEVYGWLADQPGDFAIVQYPMGHNVARAVPDSIEYQYNSMVHGKQLVNGYSGFFSPVFEVLRERAANFPSEQALIDAEALGLRYLIVNQAHYHRAAVQVRQRLRRLEPRLVRVAELGDELVYELAAPWLTGAELYARLAEEDLRPLDRRGWRISARGVNQDLPFAVDGDPATRWKTGQQSAGMSFEIDLGKVEEIVGINLGIGALRRDFPPGFRVETSADGDGWQTVLQESGYVLPITEFLHPLALRLPLRFDPVAARYLRMVITEPRPDHVWSIFEVDALTPVAGGAAAAMR